MAAAIAVALLFGGIVVLLFPANKDKLDFSEFYAAAQMVREGHGKELYDLRLQAEFQSRVAAVHAVYLRPPFETLLFIPFSYFSYRTAYTLWVALNLLLIGLGAFFIESFSQVSRAFWRYVKIHADFGLLLAVFLTFAPTTTCLLLGQDAILMLLVYTAAFILLRRGRGFWAGCILACGLFKFHLILPFVFILALRKMWPVLAGFVASATALTLISIRISGLVVLLEYPSVLFFDKSNRELMGFNPAFTPNIHGLLYLLGKGASAGWAITIVIVALSGAVVLLAATYWRDDRFEISFSTAMLATLLVSYHSYNYDLVLLLLPVALTCGQVGAVNKLSRGKKLLLATLLIVFVPQVHFSLVTHGMYALMCVPISFLFVLVLRLQRQECQEEGVA